VLMVNDQLRHGESRFVATLPEGALSSQLSADGAELCGHERFAHRRMAGARVGAKRRASERSGAISLIAGASGGPATR